jgi:hypothetical protein
MKIHLQMKHTELSAEEIRTMLAPFTKQHSKMGKLVNDSLHIITIGVMCRSTDIEMSVL